MKEAKMATIRGRREYIVYGLAFAYCIRAPLEPRNPKYRNRKNVGI
jgi:hypothetical protein